jgi:hypothetical protein
MIVTLTISESSRLMIISARKAAGEAQAALSGAIQASVAAGASEVQIGLVTGRYGLTMRNPGQAGLADCVMGWMIDPAMGIGAVGVPSNSPAARYATILEYGGTIVPKSARALAIPLTDEARKYSSPREMAGLTLVSRPGHPPLLVREVVKRGKVTAFEAMWVLVSSVTITGRNWLSRGVTDAVPAMHRAFEGVLNALLRRFKGGS